MKDVMSKPDNSAAFLMNTFAKSVVFISNLAFLVVLKVSSKIDIMFTCLKKSVCFLVVGYWDQRLRRFMYIRFFISIIIFLVVVWDVTNVL